MLKGGAPITDHRELVLVQNDPNFNEMQPKPLVPYSTIYGVAAPATLPYLPNDGSQHVELPAGRQFGLIGTASFYQRDTTPGGADPNGPYNGLDPFNTVQNDGNPNWFPRVRMPASTRTPIFTRCASSAWKASRIAAMARVRLADRRDFAATRK